MSLRHRPPAERGESSQPSLSTSTDKATPSPIPTVVIPKWVGPSLLVEALRVLVLATCVLALGVILRVSPRVTEPVYGNVFAYLHFESMAALAYALGGVLGWTLGQPTMHQSHTTSPEVLGGIHRCVQVLLVLAALLAASPSLVRHLLPYRMDWGPYLGPHLTQLVHGYPAAFLVGVASVQPLYPLFDMKRMTPRYWLIQGSLLAGLWFTGAVVQAYLNPTHTCETNHMFAIQITVVSVVVAMVQSYLTQNENPGSSQPTMSLFGFLPVKRLVPCVTVLLLVLRSSVVEPVCKATSVPDTFNPMPNLPIRVVDREESVTGWISVIKNEQSRYMALRSGYSFIGGRWEDPNESIFITFYAMEGARLVEGRAKNDSQPQRGLQLGLGVGICTDSLQRSGVLMDVVEIDPVVYRFARKYFDLQEPHQVYLQDGRAFIEHVAQNETYDYIFHDVFAGGSVPASLFSVEALEQVKRILKPDGVLALNFVGSHMPPNHRAFLYVWKTLAAVFPNVVCHPESTKDPSAVLNY
ncbi:hypothetical protein IWQ62_005385, partial [Dispira parvispora]